MSSLEPVCARLENQWLYNENSPEPTRELTWLLCSFLESHWRDLSSFIGFANQDKLATGWRRCIGCIKMQASFGKRATNYRALWRKMKYQDKASYASSPPCTSRDTSEKFGNWAGRKKKVRSVILDSTLSAESMYIYVWEWIYMYMYVYEYMYI